MEDWHFYCSVEIWENLNSAPFSGMFCMFFICMLQKSPCLFNWHRIWHTAFTYKPDDQRCSHRQTFGWWLCQQPKEQNVLTVLFSSLGLLTLMTVNKLVLLYIYNSIADYGSAESSKPLLWNLSSLYSMCAIYYPKYPVLYVARNRTRGPQHEVLNLQKHK